MEITVNGLITEQQYISMMMRFRLLKTDSLVLLSIGAIVFAVAVFELFFGSQYTMGFLIFALYLLAYWPLRLYFFYRKSYVTSKALQGLMHYTFRDDVIATQSVNGTGDLNWDALDRVLNTRNAFFLYQNNNVFSPVMKHWFTPEQLDEFVAFVKAKEGLKAEGF